MLGDVDGRGTLDTTELTKLLQLCKFQFDEQKVGEQCDTNGDGVIDYGEFTNKVLVSLVKHEVPQGL